MILLCRLANSTDICRLDNCLTDNCVCSWNQNVQSGMILALVISKHVVEIIELSPCPVFPCLIFLTLPPLFAILWCM